MVHLKVDGHTQKNIWLKRSLLLGASVSMMAIAPTAFAQDAGAEEVIVTGIRQTLENALIEKRESNSLVEIILADDIGKLPDQNLAEVLENITGIQITRTSGVGTEVQIRGTNDNRTEINGVSTLGSGSGRNGIDFEDINASIIAGVEVTKVPEAKTIEGSVGGTINLRTIRPLELKGPLISARVQAEQNNLSEEGLQPRFSGALGNNWSTGIGEIGVVLSGSYTEQEAVSFRPRVDRDNLATIPGNDPEQFLGIQFLVQEVENDDFETINLAGTLEWEPTEELHLYFDGFYNDQERSRDQVRLQASGIAGLIGINPPDSFETVDFGQGIDLGDGPGVVPAALSGTIARNTLTEDDGNLRFTSETNARVSDSTVFAIGGDWERDNLKVAVELTRSRADTETPNLSSTLNFLNPNSNLVANVATIDPVTGESTGTTAVALVGDIATLQDAVNSVPNGVLTNADGTENLSQIANDNATPFIFDLSDETLSFGIDFNNPEAPTIEQLLDLNNLVLDAVNISEDTNENTEDSVRFDLSYDLSDNDAFGGVISSVDVGYRYNETTSTASQIDDNIGGFSVLEDSPNASLFSELIVEGPDNFDDADDRELFIENFLLVDPDAAFEDREGTIAILEAALAEQRVLNPLANGELTSEPVLDQDAFFDVTEDTHSVYAQLNFESGPFRGNLGARYVNTNVSSTGFQGDDLITIDGSYDFILPRFNLVVDATEKLAIRLGYSQDILRPDFDDLGGFSFGASENGAVTIGNSSLSPQTVDSFDISFDWYFAPASVFSVGVFEKNRTNLFVSETSSAILLPSDVNPGGFARETDPTCPGGGIFNPEVIPNVLGDPNTLGLCVDLSTTVNDLAVVTQRGVEVAFQGDLSSFEDKIGWASGFGLIANYTFQDFVGGSQDDTASGRGSAVLGDIAIPEGLLDFSQNAYNITGFYEKFGLSARLRYTWRDEFRTNDFGGGANVSGSSTFGFPVVTEARGQLNGSISYDITDQFSVGVEAINLTTSNVVQRAVSADGPIAFVGNPDRRIVFGGSYTF